MFPVLFKGVEHDARFPIGCDIMDVNPKYQICKDGTSNVPKQSHELNEVYNNFPYFNLFN